MGSKARLCRAGVIGVAMLATSASAQSYSPYAPPTPYRQPPSYPQPQPYPQQRYAPQPNGQQICCTVAEGTEVAVQLTRTVSTKTAAAGDTIPLRLAAPLVIDGQIVLPKGTPGEGKVIQASGAGAGGKGAKLVVSADFLMLRGGTLPPRGLQLTGTGKDHSFAADMVSMAGWVSLPLSLAGFIVPGGDIEIPEGTNAAAKVARSVSLKPLGAAAPEDYANVQQVFGGRETTHGKIVIPPPPTGMGKVVFFRASGFGSTAYTVREDGKALGRLGGGSWFSVPLKPGLHSFTASSEPVFKDSLTLKIDPGETYFVEGLVTHGLLIGAADLTPSAKSRFDGLFADAKIASPAPRG